MSRGAAGGAGGAAGKIEVSSALRLLFSLDCCPSDSLPDNEISIAAPANI